MEKMNRAIAESGKNSEAAAKCAALAKEYTLKVIDNISHFKDSDGDRVYTNIVKTRMAVQCDDI